MSARIPEEARKIHQDGTDDGQTARRGWTMSAISPMKESVSPRCRPG